VLQEWKNPSRPQQTHAQEEMTMAKSKSNPVLDTLQKAAQGLVFISETDAELEPFIWNESSDLDEDKVKKLAGSDTDAPVEKTTLDGFFRAVPPGKKKQFNELAKTLKDNLSDVRVYKIGEVEKDVYIVGKTKDGQWAGLKTNVVET
jgi:hypothetical protein